MQHQPTGAPAPRSRIAWAVAAWTVALLAFANAALHVHAVAWSLIASDNWNHVHPLLQDGFAGRLDLGNFLIQRAGVDHAQPLGKLVMWANARWFGLDFRLEGYLGLAFGLVLLGLLYRLVAADAPWRARGPAWWLAFAAVPAVLFSLNTSFIYVYTMVTLWFALYACAFLVVLCAARVVEGGRAWPLALATLLLGIIADDSAFLVLGALCAALALRALRDRDWRAHLPAIAAIAVALLASRLLYWAFGETAGTTQAVFNQPLPARVAALAAQWRDAWLWFAVPASSGVAGHEGLRAMAGEGWGLARQVLAIAMVAAHAWFWYAAFTLRTSRGWLAAVVLMLMFYAHVAAILAARVFVRGVGYMDQERYVSFYQFGVLALLLMAMVLVAQRTEASAGSARTARGPIAGMAVSALAIALLLVQLPLTLAAKAREAGIWQHNRQMALDMARVARDPLADPGTCASGMDLCVLPPERRALLVSILREHRLQLFSPQYARRHPEDAAAVAQAVAASGDAAGGAAPR